MAFTPPSSIAPSSVTVVTLPLPPGAATEATLARIKRDLDEIAWRTIESAEKVE